MEGLFFSLPLMIVLLFSSAAAAAASPASFILASCKPTAYPSLCIQSLSSYAPLIRRSPRQLAHAALTVSASRAREASAYVSRLSSGTGHRPVHQSQVASPSLQDCMATMTDSADKLQRSLRQFRHLGRAGRRSFAARLGDVQTWVSAAITDQSTCLLSLTQDGGMSDGPTLAAMRKKVAEVSRVTSNALALVDRLGGNH